MSTTEYPVSASDGPASDQPPGSAGTDDRRARAQAAPEFVARRFVVPDLDPEAARIHAELERDDR